MEHISKYLENRSVTSQEPTENFSIPPGAPAKRDWLTSRNGDLIPLKNIDQFKLAIACTRIQNLDDMEPLRQALRYVMLLLGIRAKNLPVKEEKAVLLNYIITRYAGHTPDEIKLAFELALSGQLDIDDANCYENFSPAYFSKIMNAYRAWAIDQHKMLPPSYHYEEKKESPERCDNREREEVEIFYQQWKRVNKIPTIDDIPYYFERILSKDNLLQDGEDLAGFFSRRLTAQSTGIYEYVKPNLDEKK